MLASSVFIALMKLMSMIGPDDVKPSHLFIFQALPSKCSLAASFLSGLVVPAVILVLQCCRHFI